MVFMSKFFPEVSEELLVGLEEVSFFYDEVLIGREGKERGNMLVDPLDEAVNGAGMEEVVFYEEVLDEGWG